MYARTPSPTPAGIHVYISENKVQDFLDIVKTVVAEVGRNPGTVKVKKAHESEFPFYVVRQSITKADPDGDALNGFTRPSEPTDCVFRLISTRSTARKAKQSIAVSQHKSQHGSVKKQAKPPPPSGCTIMVDPNGDAQRLALVRLKNRERINMSSIERQRAREPPEYFKKFENPQMYEVEIPNMKFILEEISDRVAAHNEDNGPVLAPLLRQSVLIISAACSIQAAYRARRERRRMEPSLTDRVLHRRAILFIQRWFRAHMLKMRLEMLLKVKRLLFMCPRPLAPEEVEAGRTSDRELCISKQSWDRLTVHVKTNPPPSRFLPEQYLQFAFAESDTTTVFMIKPPAASEEPGMAPARRPVSQWLHLNIPSTSSEALQALEELPSLYGRSDVLPLLEQDVLSADVPKFSSTLVERLGGGQTTHDVHGRLIPVEERPWKHFRFKCNEDLRQRCALIFLFTYDIRNRCGVELTPNPFAVEDGPSPIELYPGLFDKIPHSPSLHEQIDEQTRSPRRSPRKSPGRSPRSPRKTQDSGRSTGRIPMRLIQRLPENHHLMKYSTPPLHRLPPQTTKQIETVHYFPKLIAREKPSHLNEVVEMFEREPVPCAPRRPTTAERQRAEIEEEVTQAMAAVVEKHFPTCITAGAPGSCLSVPDRYLQALLIKEETDRLLHQRRTADVTKENARREAISEAMSSVAGVLRSVNTSSLPPLDHTTRAEVQELARQLRAEVARAAREMARAARAAAELARDQAEKDHADKQVEIYQARTTGHHERMTKIVLARDKDEDQKAKMIQRRRWQLRRKKEAEEDRKFVKGFTQQHNALSKQMVSAEIAHLQGMDWHYTCREVDGRREQTQQRKQDVEMEQNMNRAVQRDIWLEKAAQTALAREELLIEMEEERQVARARNEQFRAQHHLYAPKHGLPYRIPPLKQKTTLNLTRVVSEK